MDQQKNSKKITAIVPAYNEADRIGSVLDILIQSKKFSEIIVIDDGSTDGTGKVVRNFPVRYFRNEENMGKGFSMDRGVKLAQNDIIFFCDADITGLTNQILEETIRPVLNGDQEMFIAMRNRKAYNLNFFLKFVPLLGGERALTKKLWLSLPSFYKHRFRIETGLNFYARYYGKGFNYKVFKNFSQKIKEKKYGFLKGFRQRLSMYGDVIYAQLRLQFIDVPKTVREGRIAVFNALWSTGGLSLSAVMLFGVYIGPYKLISILFRSELIEDPDAPMANYILSLAREIKTGDLLVAGLILLGFCLIILILSVFKIFRLSKNINN